MPTRFFVHHGKNGHDGGLMKWVAVLCNEWNCREQNNNNNNHEIQNDGCSFFHSRISILVVGDDEARVEGRVISPFISANGGLRDRFIGGIHACHGSLFHRSCMHGFVSQSAPIHIQHSCLIHHHPHKQATEILSIIVFAVRSMYIPFYGLVVFVCRSNESMQQRNNNSGIKKTAPKTHTTANSQCFSSRGSPPRKSWVTKGTPFEILFWIISKIRKSFFTECLRRHTHLMVSLLSQPTSLDFGEEGWRLPDYDNDDSLVPSHPDECQAIREKNSNHRFKKVSCFIVARFLFRNVGMPESSHSRLRGRGQPFCCFRSHVSCWLMFVPRYYY